MYAAVERVFDRKRPIGWELEATGYFYVDFNDMPLAGIVVAADAGAAEIAAGDHRRGRAVHAAERHGRRVCHVAGRAGINLSTIDYVNTFVPKQIGENYQSACHDRRRTDSLCREDEGGAVSDVQIQGRRRGGVSPRQFWHRGERTVGVAAGDGPGACDCRGRLSNDDPLPSWNEGPAKAAIMKFVAEVTTPGTPNFVPPHERIATFDNDGTLWCEMPIYTQCAF